MTTKPETWPEKVYAEDSKLTDGIIYSDHVVYPGDFAVEYIRADIASAREQELIALHQEQVDILIKNDCQVFHEQKLDIIRATLEAVKNQTDFTCRINIDPETVLKELK